MRHLVFLLLAMLLPQPLLAADAFFTASLERLAALDGFQCRFTQELLYADGSNQRYAGELAVRRPGMFRWQYAEPYEQLYVSDGKLIWHYEPDLMQAEMLAGLEAVDPVVLRLLDGRLSAADVRLLDRELAEGLHRFRVQLPGSEPVWLVFDTEYNLRRIERRDVLGNINRMHLSGCTRLAPSLNLFSFSPPAGVDVVDLRPTHETLREEP